MPIPGAVPASLGRRLLAAVIDGVAALLLGGGFALAGTVQLFEQVGAGATDRVAAAAPGVPVLTVVGGVVLLVVGVVQWVLLGTRGWTLGKKLVSLRVLDARTGRPLGLGRAFVRLLVPGVSGVVPLVGPVLVGLSPLFDDSGRRQGWHDKAAGSVVLDVAVGRDPMTSAAPDASARIDALLRSAGSGAPVGEQAAEPRRTPPPPAPAPPTAPPPAALPPAATAPAPVAPAPATPGPAAAPPPPAPRPPAPVAAVPAPQEAVTRAPQVAHAPAPQPPAPVAAPPVVQVSGPALSSEVSEMTAPVISSVPGRPSRPAGAAADERHVGPEPSQAVPARTAQPLTEQPVPGPSAPSSPAPPPSDRTADDVESTRLRPARGRVPELPDEAPSSAVLHVTDGRRVALTGTVLVGRNPSPRAGEDVTELVRVADPGRSVSKTHLAVGVDRLGVWLRDRNSTNGTVVTLADGQQILCGANQQVRVPVGASVAFGDYGFTVEPAPASPDEG
ncbi:FHA domain-containing protein [Cellulomonas sp. APG4]|uniref:RDD family protein n=1 Tax=Cellulomonas sp. APG4 TaxID=1538656 RepID=UPI00137B1984|nr:RDD family protein [Cellulomonas sp. APG4]NCT89728.1 FHA domain-containing protein [Cellulomonas sp. APG4]